MRTREVASALAAVGASAALLLTGTGVAAAAAPELTGRNSVERALERLVGDGGPPGAQAVVTERHRSWESTRGVGDLRTGEPFPHHARLRIASNTKPFVAVVVLQLVAAGRVELDAPVERHLPGLLRGDGVDGHRITVRQLLQHTSGLPEYTRVLDDREARWKHYEPVDLVRAALTLKADFAPGTGWSYSNTGYIVLGMLIERVTGNPVAAEITRRVLRPLHLTSTYYPRPHETGIRGPHPRGYDQAPGEPLVDYTEQDPSRAGAAGAMISTGQDLNRFFTALLGGRLLPAAQLAEMKRVVVSKEHPGGYGLGLIRYRTSCGNDLWGHGGTIPGFRTRGGVADDGRAVNVAVNQVIYREGASTEVVKVVDAAVCGR